MIYSTLNEIVLKEEVNIKDKGYRFKSFDKNDNNLNKDIETIFERNLIDDTFNILYMPWMKEHAQNKLKLSVNDNLITEAKDAFINSIKHNDNGVSSIYKNILPGKIHRSAMDNAKFSDISNVILSRESDTSPYLSHIWQTNIKKQDKQIYLNENSVLKISNPWRFKYNSGASYFMQNPFENTRYPLTSINTTTDYYNLYFVPEKLNQLNENNVVFNVFHCVNDGEFPTKLEKYNIFHLLNSAEMLTTGLGKEKVKLVFEDDSNSDDIYMINENKYAKKIGHFIIDAFTYYDYIKKKTQIGMNQHAIKGEIIPYNFDGEYVRSIKLEVNELLKDLNIVLSYNIEEPLLDVYNGKFILEIDNNYQNHLILSKSLSKSDVQNLHTIMKDNKSNIINLKWFERNSEHVQN